MKLYDGRGKQFKKLIDPKVIMKENRLKLTDVLPKHARPKWFVMWFWWSIWIAVVVVLLFLFVHVFRIFLHNERAGFNGFIDFILGTLLFGLFWGGFAVIFFRRWTWRSDAIAIRVMAQNGFCPNCGYIIRDTPSESDGCTPCSECGHAWRVEPVDC